MEYNWQGLNITYDSISDVYIANAPDTDNKRNIRTKRTKIRRKIREKRGLKEDTSFTPTVLFRGIDQLPIPEQGKASITAEQLLEEGKTMAIVNLDVWYPEYTEQFIALDCEMVGVGNNQSKLARVSLTDWSGNVKLDLHVKVENVTDYRTEFSGITKEDLEDGICEEECIKQVKEQIKNKIIIGHDLKHDFKVLHMKPKPENVRDTANYTPLRKNYGDDSPLHKNLKPRKLKTLVQMYCSEEGDYENDSTKSTTWRDFVQEVLAILFNSKNCKSKKVEKKHCSVEDSRNAMKVFQKFHFTWDTNYEDFLQQIANESKSL